MPSQSYPWYAYYPENFMSATLGWSLAERGAYRALLDVQWLRGGLPDSVSKMAKMVGCSTKQMTGIWERRLEEKFPLCEDGQRRNSRLEKEREQAAKRSARSAKVADARWKKLPKSVPKGITKGKQKVSLENTQVIETEGNENATADATGDAILQPTYKSKENDLKVTKEISLNGTTICPENFWPEGAAETILEGLTREQAQDVVRGFVAYWRTSETKRKNWNLTFAKNGVAKSLAARYRSGKGNGRQKGEDWYRREMRLIDERERENQQYAGNGSGEGPGGHITQDAEPVRKQMVVPDARRGWKDH